MLEILRAQQTWAGLNVDDSVLERAINATRAFLAESATLEFEDVQFGEGRLTFDLAIMNRTGHKLPTGYPTRRMWLEVRATDEAGVTVWHSGAVDAAGNIAGMAQQPWTPHYDVINDASQVQIYQSIMTDRTGERTHTLLAATEYAKDNRILPTGWDPRGPFTELTASVGVDGDGNFQAGGDRVTYVIESQAAVYRVDVTLWYQSIPPDAVDALQQNPTPASVRLAQFVELTPATPSALATINWQRTLAGP
jgi:hypothetical protein